MENEVSLCGVKTTIHGEFVEEGKCIYSEKNNSINCNFGNKGIAPHYANKVFEWVHNFCKKNDISCVVAKSFYDAHKSLVEKLLVDKGVLIKCL